MKPKLTGLTFRTATPARWRDIERLFGERGACGGCWCMAWRLAHKDYVAGKGEENKRALRSIVRSGGKPGVLAFIDKDPVGWCAVAPRDRFPALARSRVLAPIDERPVWSVSCLFVLRPYRMMGLSSLLIRAAVDLAKKQGAKIVEGYPFVPSMTRMPAPFIWTGVPSAFRKAGFKVAARRSQARPIMRRATQGGEL